MAKAAIYSGANKPFEVRDYNLEKPKKGYALLELIASGVCGTDLHIHTGRLPVTPPMMIGHEFVGKIVEINDERSDLKAGENVISCIAVPCGECLLCKNGDDANCVNMGLTYSSDPDDPPHFFGGYGEYSFSPAANLVKIPPSLDPVAVCAFSCAGPTSMHAFSLMKKAGIDISNIKSAVVQGFGPVGIFSLLYLYAAGVPDISVITARENSEKAELAKSFGAGYVYSLEKHNPEEISADIKKRSGNLGADLAFEGSGNPKAIPLGLELLRNRGVYLIPGQYSNSGEVSIAPQQITFKALQIIGSSQYSLCDIRDYLEFMLKNSSHIEKIKKIISGYKVDDINKAITDAESGKNIKTMLIK